MSFIYCLSFVLFGRRKSAHPGHSDNIFGLLVNSHFNVSEVLDNKSICMYENDYLSCP